MRVLIIEDELILLKMYRDKFENNGFEVSTAVEGEEGLSRAINDQPDFIILDLMMPKMDGMELLKRLKENENTRNIPVAILTVVPVEQVPQLTDELLAQVTHYWMKDVTKPSDVVRDVKKYLKI